MATTTTTRTTVREWSTPEKTKITGEPPGPDAKISHTSRGEFRRQDLRVVTPIYKSQTLTSATPSGGTTVHVKSESKISPPGSENRYPDYKVEKEHDSYRLHIIDPKVDTRYRANSPIFNNLPAYLRKRNKTPDFPSAHSKRSFLKMEALENKRLRSYGTKIISPQEYLLESVNRHRSVSMSPLRDRLNLKDRDVNLPWDPALHPGYKKEVTQLKTQLFETSTSKKHDWSKNDLDDLAKRRERLFDRSKNRSALNINEYRKVDPNYVDLPEREYLDDSLEMSKSSTGRDPYRSQSVMSTTEWESYDRNISKTRSQTNLASWQFNNASFSPRSVINVNGHNQNDAAGLLKIRTDLSPAPYKMPAAAQPPPPIQKSNAGVQTQTKTEQVTRTVVNEPGQQPPYWNVPPGVMPQIVFVPVAAAPTSAPNTLTRETVKEEKVRYVRDYEPGAIGGDSRQGTLIRIKDESAKKPPSSTASSSKHHHRKKHVIKQEKYESEGENAENNRRQVAIPRQNLLKEFEQPALLEPKVTETVSTVEETKRTEEVERRVRADKKHRRKEHKTKQHRSHEGHLEDGAGRGHERTIGYGYGADGHTARALDYPSWASGEQRSSFGVQNGYHPSVTETFQRESTTRRMHESDVDDHGRLRYTENGDVNNGGQDKLHRSYSSTNVYREFPRQNELYYENSRPIVEYPPSTTATMDDRFYNRHGSRHLGRYGRRGGGSELSSSPSGVGPTTPRNGGRLGGGGDSLLMPAAGAARAKPATSTNGNSDATKFRAGTKRSAER